MSLKKRTSVKRLDEKFKKKNANMKKIQEIVVGYRGTNICPALTFNLSAVYLFAILLFLDKLQNYCIQLSSQACCIYSSFDHNR